MQSGARRNSGVASARKAAVTTWDALLGEGTMPGISPEVPGVPAAPGVPGVPVARGQGVARPAAAAGRHSRHGVEGVDEGALVRTGAEADVAGGTGLADRRAVGQ